MAMSGDNPKVSVCLMTYNGAGTVERALTTLLAQTYRDYELIISDDHSTDETLAICQRVAAGHKHVRFIRPAHNLGAERNMKFALSQARGTYYVWACQDDYWEPAFLERLVGLLEQSPSAICAQSWVRWISEKGDDVEDLRLYGRDLPERQSRIAFATSILTRRGREDRPKIKNSIFTHGIWKRAAFSAALEAHRRSIMSERQILCQLALAGEFRYLDEPLFNKTYYDVELYERRPATDTTVIEKARSSPLRELLGTLVAIARSPIVELRTKIFALPILACSYYRHRLRGKVLRRLTRALSAS